MARLGWRFVLVLAASTTSLAADAAPQVPVGAPEAPKQCGELSYLPSTYTCFGNTTLCPVSMGIASRPCTASGVNSGCYSPYDYSCDAATGKLKPLPPATSPFTLTSYAKQSWLNGLQVKACGGYLAMGAGAHQCATCRGAPNGTDCSKFGNKPVLLPDGKMVGSRPPF